MRACTRRTRGSHMLQDPANVAGGKWIVRVNKGFVSRLWEDLILAVIGDQACSAPTMHASMTMAVQFDVGDEICGAVVSIRYHEDIIALWNKTASNADVTGKIRCLICHAFVHV